MQEYAKQVQKKPHKLGMVLLSLLLTVILGAGGYLGTFLLIKAQDSSSAMAANTKEDITREQWIVQLIDAVSQAAFTENNIIDLGEHFTDVPIMHKNYMRIQSAAIYGWLPAEVQYGVFQPDEIATREFIVTTAVRASGYIFIDGDEKFPEEIISADDPEMLLIAYRLGIIGQSEKIDAHLPAKSKFTNDILNWVLSEEALTAEGHTNVIEYKPNGIMSENDGSATKA